MPGCVLDETRLVAEAVAAVFSGAMEMCLMLSVSTVDKGTILIETETDVTLRNWLIL